MSRITAWILSLALTVGVGALAAHYDTEADAHHSAPNATAQAQSTP